MSSAIKKLIISQNMKKSCDFVGFYISEHYPWLWVKVTSSQTEELWDTKYKSRTQYNSQSFNTKKHFHIILVKKYDY